MLSEVYKSCRRLLKAYMDADHALSIWLRVIILIMNAGLCKGRTVTMGLLAPSSGSRSFGIGLNVTVELALRKVGEYQNIMIEVQNHLSLI